jgi:hypothetical protein
MLLRASSEAAGENAELETTVGGGGDGGVHHGALLVRYAEAVTRGSDDMDDARQALRGAIGEPALILAASIVGIFNGLVRTADSTGIPLDENTLHSSKGFREELALNEYAGSANSELGRADATRARGDSLDDATLDSVMRQFN